MNHKKLLLITTLIYSLAPLPLHATRLTTAFATYEGAWGLAAVANLSRFRTNLFDDTMDAISLGEPQGHKRYDLFPPIVTCPPSTSLTLVGEPEGGGDGGKWLCAPLSPPDNCVVYSLGSANNYQFEDAILKQTNCRVYTYDCTIDGRSIDTSRHFFNKQCIGPRKYDQLFNRMLSWEQVLKANNHAQTYIVKADIEGFEWGLLADWRMDTPGLPHYLAVELHLDRFPDSTKTDHLDPKPGADLSMYDYIWRKKTMTSADAALLFQHLASLGYAAISREDNHYGTCCSEYVFMRVEHPREHWKLHAAGLTGVQTRL